MFHLDPYAEEIRSKVGWHQSAPEHPFLLSVALCGIPVFSFFRIFRPITSTVHVLLSGERHFTTTQPAGLVLKSGPFHLIWLSDLKPQENPLESLCHRHTELKRLDIYINMLGVIQDLGWLHRTENPNNSGLNKIGIIFLSHNKSKGWKFKAV